MKEYEIIMTDSLKRALKLKFLETLWLAAIILKSFR